MYGIVYIHVLDLNLYNYSTVGKFMFLYKVREQSTVERVMYVYLSIEDGECEKPLKLKYELKRTAPSLTSATVPLRPYSAVDNASNGTTAIESFYCTE